MKDGSEKGSWDPWLARPTSREEWIGWQKNDRVTMAEKNKVSLPTKWSQERSGRVATTRVSHAAH